ncbi:hypothetical protein TK45_05510, partial [Bowmanella sp. JS7-9]
HVGAKRRRPQRGEYQDDTSNPLLIISALTSNVGFLYLRYLVDENLGFDSFAGMIRHIGIFERTSVRPAG